MRIDRALIQQRLEPQQQISRFRATIDPAYTSGRPKLIKDGETTVQGKPYPYLSSYTPAANDRVFIIDGIIQGKIM